MDHAPAEFAPDTPLFHSGEQAIQDRLGVRESQEIGARRVMHPYIPEKQRRFFAQLPFVLVGSVDDAGWPWASMVWGPPVPGSPGFVTTPGPQTFRVNTAPLPGDPLTNNLRPGAPISFLGIELPTRRRNRVNGTLTDVGPDHFTARVDQFYGNCPKYIQNRTPAPGNLSSASGSAPATDSKACNSLHTTFTQLNADTTAVIRAADTFFVASQAPQESNASKADTVRGVDINHRGGKPGFVKVEGNTLTIPDYFGNNLFNTLGNLLLNHKAGLLFPDFQTGRLTQLVGTTEILWEDHPEVQAFEGALRAWRFHLDHGHTLPQVTPLHHWAFQEYSPFLKNTGAWPESGAASG